MRRVFIRKRELPVRKILHSRRKFQTDQTGATKVEYVLIAAGIILAIIAAYGTLRKGAEPRPESMPPNAVQDVSPDMQ